MKNKLGAWLYAFRLRTLPLAASSMITGNAAAFFLYQHRFSYTVLGLSLLTTVLLQILSNLANDYGDSEKGTDNEERIGPKRAIQSGMLSFSEIKAGIFITTVLCLVSGISLLYAAFGKENVVYALLFLGLGLGAIAAAVKYTVGAGAYGYKGLGDVFVLLFFGLVGVGGSYFLQSHELTPSILLPAFTIGFFSSGVLNLNNMRDRWSDERAGKNTLAVKLGDSRSRIYHHGLIYVGFAATLLFTILHLSSSIQFLYVLTAPIFRRHLVAVRTVQDPKDFDPQLKVLALGTFIFSLLFGAGLVLAM